MDNIFRVLLDLSTQKSFSLASLNKNKIALLHHTDTLPVLTALYERPVQLKEAAAKTKQ